MLKNAPLIAKIGVDTDETALENGGEPPTPSFPEDSSDCTAPHENELRKGSKKCML